MENNLSLFFTQPFHSIEIWGTRDYKCRNCQLVISIFLLKFSLVDISLDRSIFLTLLNKRADDGAAALWWEFAPQYKFHQYQSKNALHTNAAHPMENGAFPFDLHLLSPSTREDAPKTLYLIQANRFTSKWISTTVSNQTAFENGFSKFTLTSSNKKSQCKDN